MRNVVVLGAVLLAACDGADGAYCVSETAYELNGYSVREVVDYDPQGTCSCSSRRRAGREGPSPA